MKAPKRFTQACSLTLALVLAAGCIPASAFADDVNDSTRSIGNAETATGTDDTLPPTDVSHEPVAAQPVSPEPVTPSDPIPAPDTGASTTVSAPDASAEQVQPSLPTLSVGWNLINGAWYYGNVDGSPRTGWLNDKGSWYWLIPEENGRMAIGWANAEGYLYCFNNSGIMQSGGWKKISGVWYYLHKSGAAAKGWLKDKGSWYWLDPTTGAMATGWVEVDGTWYYLNKSGAMATGWKKVGGVWYYLNKSGAMATGWKKIDGTWYYLNPENGAMKTRWLDLDGTWYYLKSSGAMVTGSYVVDGKSHMFSKSGVWQGRDKVEELFTKWAQPESSNTNWLILVDTKRCKVGIFYGSKNNWTLKKLYSCAPGKASTPTIKGRFTVGNKGYYFDSGAARCFYFTQISGNYLFHSVLYYQNSTPSAVMDGRVGQGLSHGCVRLELANAKWIYNNIPRGTKVYIW